MFSIPGADPDVPGLAGDDLEQVFNITIVLWRGTIITRAGEIWLSALEDDLTIGRLQQYYTYIKKVQKTQWDFFSFFELKNIGGKKFLFGKNPCL